ncbi:mucin-2-like [Dorcoceras hygrometricum]|uniref:Mucin-2-like n=1 Tax=Dorcoceras hygrometricum TaxID=472368 RepID=A0A2Z7CDV1_9LAMI|nr:mucin-2-like [Dorcoceras hygrometricum]
MASSLISSSHHVDFDSVFGMEDTGMVQMFESLIATGLKNFLGCPAVFLEAALTEFFANGSVRYGLVVSTVNGVHVEISEKVFAEAFELPIDGLTDVLDVHKNLVFDARSLFSASQEQEMVTPGSRQAKGFAIQICEILKSVPGLVLGESRVFPASRVLAEKTIHRYVAVNDKVGGEADTDAPRKRTTKGKPLVIAQEAVPLQIVEAAADAPVEQPPVPKRKSQKRKRRLILEDDLEIDEPVAGRFTAEHPVEEATTGVQKPIPESVEQPVVVPVVAPATDDPDAVIKKVLNKLYVVFQTYDGEQPQGTVVEETVVAAKEPHWFDLPYDDLIAKWDAERPVVTASDTDEDVETMDVGAAGGDQQFEILEHKDDVKKIRETLSLHNNNLERRLSDRFDSHDRTYRVLFNNVRHDMRDHKNLLSLDLKSYQQKVSIQVGAAALDTVDVRREVKAMNAKVDILSSRLDDVKKYVEETKEAISHQLLEFQSHAQANHIVLTDQLGQLIDSDLVTYRTTLLRTFQVVTICRVHKSEVLVVLISHHDSKLSMQIDSDLVIYRTTLLRTFQVVTICRVDKSEFFEEYSFVLISSALLVQPDEGVSDLVVDRIGDNLPQSTEKSRIIVIPVGGFRPTRRGESVRADLVSASSAA